MATKNEMLRELFIANGLVKDEDTYILPYGKGVTIITRSGIEKIQYNNGIEVKFEWIMMQKDFAVIKAIATKGDVVIETFGSALHGQGGNCRSNYVAEMAEKRALARAVLKLSGAYKYGVFGEDESDDFKGE